MNKTKLLLSMIFFVLIFHADPIKFRQVQIIPYGAPYKPLCFDSDTAWDFSDSVFCIRPTGIQDQKGSGYARFRLEAYPNPFKDECSIEYALPGTTGVHLAIYDASGRLVASLAKGPMNAGVYRYPIEQKDLPPGVYFILLTADSGSIGEKLIHLK